MAGRIIAIGDIHGCLPALESVLDQIKPTPEDCLITLGDYIDRGPESRATIDRLLDLSRSSELVPVLGNHDEMLLRIVDGEDHLIGFWLRFGGDATLASYGVNHPKKIPENRKRSDTRK